MCISEEGLNGKMWGLWITLYEWQGSERATGAWLAHYRMWVAGRDSSCRERKSSLCLSWCRCLSLSCCKFSPSISPSISSSRSSVSIVIGTSHTPSPQNTIHTHTIPYKPYCRPQSPSTHTTTPYARNPVHTQNDVSHKAQSHTNCNPQSVLQIHCHKDKKQVWAPQKCPKKRPGQMQ